MDNPRARDSLHSSRESLNSASENGFSSTSNLSDASRYQDEFLHLKYSLNPDKHPLITNGSSDSPGKLNFQEECMKNLTLQLQGALRENDKLKNEIDGVEKKCHLRYSFKIEQLIKHITHLESNLNDSNGRIERFMLNSHPNSHELEITNQKLNQQNLQLLNEINLSKNGRKEIELELENLRRHCGELELEISAKANCVYELKDSLSKRHVDLENISIENAKLLNSFETFGLELEDAKKSCNWYRNQLTQCQNQKTLLENRVSEYENVISTQENSLAQLKLQLNKSKCDYEKIQLEMLREKEKFLKNLEDFAVVNNNNTITTPLDVSNTPKVAVRDVEILKNYYENTLQDLSHEVLSIKMNFEEQELSLKESNRKYAELLSKHLLLQKNLQARENVIEKLETSEKVLTENLQNLSGKNRRKELEVLQLKNEISKLEISLEKEIQDRHLIEQSVISVKEQFKIFKNNYDCLKMELHQKQQEIVELQTEKQNLFMSNNWKSCQIEEVKRREITIKSLETQIENFAIQTQEFHHKTSRLAQEIDDLRGEKFELQARLLETQENCKELETKLLAKNQVVSELESKISQFKNCLNYFKKLKLRCSSLEIKTQENESFLKLLELSKDNSDTSDNVKYLQALVQVKIREQKEKQRKYEQNYRTLLGKVKEHMRGRNLAEKQYLQLQEMYNTLSEEKNSLVFNTLHSDQQIQNLEQLKQKLELKIVKLEAKKSEQCQNCLRIHGKIQELETKVENQEKLLENQKSENSSLRLKIGESQRSSEVQIQELLHQLEMVEKSSKTYQIEAKKSHQDFHNQISKLSAEKNGLSRNLEALESEKKATVQELQLTISRCNQKSEEINKLEDRLRLLNKAEENMETLISEFKMQLKIYKNEIEGLKNDRFFLQRLCKDLRTALKIQVTQHQILKDYVSKNFQVKEQEAEDYLKIPQCPTFSKSPVKYDDKYIEKLLQENNVMLQQDKPLADIQNCLSTLRNDILVLQKQITQKNSPEF